MLIRNDPRLFKAATLKKALVLHSCAREAKAMRTRIPLFLLVAIIATACSTGSYNAPATTTQPAMTASMNSQATLAQAMRKLWADHVVYTRLYIISAVNGTDDAQPTAARLLKNQEDIGNAIVPYYGAGAGQKLTDLLKQHILIAVDLVT